jgi:hypothetical protein
MKTQAVAMIKQFFIAIFLTLNLFPFYASAEFASSWGASGVKFHKKDGLIIEKKELFISATAIRCVMVIRNSSRADISSAMSFHIPSHPHHSLGSQSYWDEDVLEAKQYNHDRLSPWTLDRPDHAKLPFLNFYIKVDTKPIDVKRMDRAFKGDQDITALLKSHNLPLNPQVASCSNLPLINFDSNECKERRDILKDLKLIDQSSDPLWHKDIRFEWTQTFPAGKDTEIEYSYHPATGFISVHFDDERPPLESLAVGLLDAGCFFRNACFHVKTGLEQDLISWLLKKFSHDLQAPDQNKGTYIYDVAYMLHSDSLGQEPIKNFTLIVEHPKGGIAQACPLWPDMLFKQTSPTTIEASRTNFVPKSDLHVYIASPEIIKDVL